MDADSRRWVDGLSSSGAQRDQSLARLHELLVRIAGREVRRRAGSLQLVGPEVDDLAHQAAADALLAITAKIGEFRGDSRFTTWAYKFVFFEVSTKIGRHFWRTKAATVTDDHWERLADRLAPRPEDAAEANELLDAVRGAVATDLTDHQRRLFLAIVVQGVPMDALAAQSGTSRNTIYKGLFDARRKVRASLEASGYLRDNPGGGS